MIYDVFDSTIIDGVTMDGLGLFDIGNGIYQDSNNNTLHNIKVHSFDSFGINYNNSQYTSLYNSSIFNNSSDGIFMANTEYATIDNVYVFDNLFIGIYITNASRHNTIQNSIIFNNTYA